MKRFNKNKNYYTVLEVATNATVAEIEAAYNNKVAEIAGAEAVLGTEQAETLKAAVEEAHRVLTDEDVRKEYDAALVKRGVRVEGYVEDPEIAEKARKKLGILKPALIAALCLSIAGGSFALGRMTAKNDTPVKITSELGSDYVVQGQNELQTGSGTQTEATTEATTEAQTEATTEAQTEAATEAQTETEVRQAVYYGDINDDALVTERAQTLLNQLQAAGMNLNMETGLPYTLEEIKNIILYVNGVYQPTDEADIYYMYNQYLNLICAPLNSEALIYKVNWAGGEDSFADIVNENANNQHRVDFVTPFTYGNAYGVEYNLWLQGKLYDAIYSTDRTETAALFDEMWQSYADIMKGNGYTLDGVTYVEQSFLSRENTGSAAVTTALLFISEPLRTLNNAQEFSVIQKYIAKDDNTDTVSFDEMAAYINAVCDNEQLNQIDHAVGDDGQFLYTATTEEQGQTWGIRLQSNIKAYGYQQLYAHTNGLNK